MGLINKEIKELRDLLKSHKSGLISNTEVSAQCKIYSEIEKRERLVIKALRVTSRSGEKTANGIVHNGFISDDFNSIIEED